MLNQPEFSHHAHAPPQNYSHAVLTLAVKMLWGYSLPGSTAQRSRVQTSPGCISFWAAAMDHGWELQGGADRVDLLEVFAISAFQPQPVPSHPTVGQRSCFQE